MYCKNTLQEILNSLRFLVNSSFRYDIKDYILENYENGEKIWIDWCLSVQNDRDWSEELTNKNNKKLECSEEILLEINNLFKINNYSYTIIDELYNLSLQDNYKNIYIYNPTTQIFINEQRTDLSIILYRNINSYFNNLELLYNKYISYFENDYFYKDTIKKINSNKLEYLKNINIIKNEILHTEGCVE